MHDTPITTHCLKTWPPLFEDVLRNKKTFEYRKNDRNFHPGDAILLQEYDPQHIADPYTGKVIEILVLNVWSGGRKEIPGLPENYCIMQIKFIDYYFDQYLKSGE